MKVRCLTCGTDDIPETFGLCRGDAVVIEGDTSINDHISIWHPDEFVRVESIEDGVAIIRATGEMRS